MKYKMIVSDFDGTLAKSDDTISNETVNAIKEYTDAGGLFIISSGRMRDALEPRLKELKLDNVKMPISSFQGALVTDSLTGDVIYKVPMEKSIAIEAIEIAEQNDIYVHCYDENYLYTEKECEFCTLYCEYSKVLDKVKYVNKLSDFVKNNDIDVVKVTIIDDADKMDNTLSLINNALDGKTNFVKAAPVLIEAVDKSAGKGNTNSFIAKMFGIDKSEIIAIGDSMNDYSMVTAAGLGVAVENASEELKNAASLIAPSNDNDGVAYVLRKAIANELL